MEDLNGFENSISSTEYWAHPLGLTGLIVLVIFVGIYLAKRKRKKNSSDF
ncbi:MAG: hypothetical protein QNK23_10755 [Crocinitomicaceae bacterium]|nr:hypothetical protein [Crocinitomicaceae bacterium]MDX2361277.1 hypothetical protein [Crocinitomicaceae bacterium]